MEEHVYPPPLLRVGVLSALFIGVPLALLISTLDTVAWAGLGGAFGGWCAVMFGARFHQLRLGSTYMESGWKKLRLINMREVPRTSWLSDTYSTDSEKIVVSALYYNRATREDVARRLREMKSTT